MGLGLNILQEERCIGGVREDENLCMAVVLIIMMGMFREEILRFFSIWLLYLGFVSVTQCNIFNQQNVAVRH